MDEDIITRVARTLATRELVCWQGEYSPSPEGYARVHAETVRVLSAPDGPLAPLVAQIATVTRERDLARVLLRSLVRFERGQAHSHARPCVWDPDNRPGVRGEACVRCTDFLAARRLLGLGDEPQPEGPLVETIETHRAMHAEVPRG